MPTYDHDHDDERRDEDPLRDWDHDEEAEERDRDGPQDLVDLFDLSADL